MLHSSFWSSMSRHDASCPYANDSPAFETCNMMPVTPNEPIDDESEKNEQRLSTVRIISSIPKTGAQGTNPNWKYPSYQMFFNAIKRKKYENVHECDMPILVNIHNIVNEKCWVEILRWEALNGRYCESASLLAVYLCRFRKSGDISLSRFVGNAAKQSPKAFINRVLFGCAAPFDRHDWYVHDRVSGKEIHYIIDFYSGQKAPGSLVSIHVDVRPAVSFLGVWKRVKALFMKDVTNSRIIFDVAKE